ncbi:MAG: long-chain fatty acid--CoA ligase [Rhodoferax sp.]|nr:long-chain fatty acid--CoA ligase [Rhodoferax sp.]
MYLTAGLHRSLQRHPDKTATVDGLRRQTFSQLASRVSRLAGALGQLGVARGDRVAVLALNSDRYMETALAVWWLGGVLNPVNTRWTAGEVAYALQDCGARVLFVDDALAHLTVGLSGQVPTLQTTVAMSNQMEPAYGLSFETLIDQATPVDDVRCDNSELAAILYTGGTTGFPKGVMLSHANLWAALVGRMAEVPNPGHFITLLTAPLFHVAGLGRMLGQTVVGGTCVTFPAFNAEAVLRILASERITDVVVVPSMLQMLLEAPTFAQTDLSSLQRILWGAAPITVPLLERAFQAFPGVEFIHAYGMTETAASVSVHHIGRSAGERASGRIRSAGRAGFSTEIRIADDNGQELPRGQSGEILVRGPVVMMGYWGRPEDTEHAMRGGWLHTGDGGTMDDEGYVYVVDRIKDMVISGGENVYPAEVEEVLGRHPGVASSAVIGIPHEKWGETVHAVVVLRPDVSLEEGLLIAHCRTHLSGYKCPKSIEFRPTLPLSAAGKVLKGELRKSCAAQREVA